MDCIIFEECPKDINGKRNGKAYKYVNVGEKYLTHTIEYIDNKLESIKYMYNPNNYIKFHFGYIRDKLNILSFIFSGENYEYGFMNQIINGQFYFKVENRIDIIHFYIDENANVFNFNFNNNQVYFCYKEFI